MAIAAPVVGDTVQRLADASVALAQERQDLALQLQVRADWEPSW